MKREGGEKTEDWEREEKEERVCFTATYNLKCF